MNDNTIRMRLAEELAESKLADNNPGEGRFETLSQHEMVDIDECSEDFEKEIMNVLKKVVEMFKIAQEYIDKVDYPEKYRGDYTGFSLINNNEQRKAYRKSNGDESDYQDVSLNIFMCDGRVNFIDYHDPAILEEGWHIQFAYMEPFKNIIVSFVHASKSEEETIGVQEERSIVLSALLQQGTIQVSEGLQKTAIQKTLTDATMWANVEMCMADL